MSAPVGEKIDLLGNGKVVKEILVAGEPDNRPENGHEVTVHYTGTLTDGTKFDSSVDRGDPFKFVLGKGQVIKGWDVGVLSMCKGEKAILTLAPDFAYGPSGSPPTIPPNATLVFEVELLHFAPKKKEAWEMTTDERLNEAGALKVAGNDAFKKGDTKEAVMQYKEGVDLLSGLDDWPENEVAVGKALRLSLNLNLANAYLKLGAWLEATMAATAVLTDEPENVKALYRRGVARMRNGMPTEAKVDLRAAALKEPKNVEIRKAFEEAKELEKKQNEADKAAYSKMFK